MKIDFFCDGAVEKKKWNELSLGGIASFGKFHYMKKRNSPLVAN